MDDAGVRFAVKRIGIGLGLIGIEQNLLVQQALDVDLLAGIEFRGAVLGIRAIPKAQLVAVRIVERDPRGKVGFIDVETGVMRTRGFPGSAGVDFFPTRITALARPCDERVAAMNARFDRITANRARPIMFERGSQREVASDTML